MPPTGQTDDSPSKPNETSGDEEAISEESLRAMTLEQLQDLCAQNGVQLPAEAQTQEDAVDWLLSEFGA